MVEVQNPRQRPRWLVPCALASIVPQSDERLLCSGGDLPVPPQESQPPPGAEYICFLHAPWQQQVLVTNGDGGEDEPLGVHHVRLGVDGRRQQVPHSVGGPGEEQSHSRQERQQPRNSPGVGTAEEDVPQAVQGCVFQEEFPGFGERSRLRLRSSGLAHFRETLVRVINISPAVVTVNEP